MTELEQKYTDAYHAHYARIPDEFRGSLMFEAVCWNNENATETSHMLDRIVEAYHMGQHYKASTLLKQLLDDYRADMAMKRAKDVCGM